MQAGSQRVVQAIPLRHGTQGPLVSAAPSPSSPPRYDAWTEEGILEYYWGEHIHLGVYSEAERAAGYTKKNFKQAKYDFIDEMLRFSGAPPNPGSILDVGCGFGGTSRHLAKKFPGTQVKGRC